MHSKSAAQFRRARVHTPRQHWASPVSHPHPPHRRRQRRDVPAGSPFPMTAHGGEQHHRRDHTPIRSAPRRAHGCPPASGRAGAPAAAAGHTLLWAVGRQRERTDHTLNSQGIGRRLRPWRTPMAAATDLLFSDDTT